MHNRLGFTLIELMLALAIMAIILCYALPIGVDYVDRSRILQVRMALIQAVRLGEIAALERGHSMTLCPSRNGRDCGGLWSQGWILTDRQDQWVPVAWQPRSTRLTLNWEGWGRTANLEISPQLADRHMTGHFTLSAGERQESLILNRIGRWRIATPNART